MLTYWKERNIDDRNIIRFAAVKKHICLYPGDEAASVFADALKDHDVSKENDPAAT